MSITLGRSEGQLDRDIQINKDVFALGVAILQGKQQTTARTALQQMHGMDWVPVPYSLARAMHDAITVAVMRRLPYVGTNKLIELDEKKGELRLTPLGHSGQQAQGQDRQTDLTEESE